jgi:hypothetical protein
MIDQFVRAVCSPAWTSMLGALLMLWWALAVTYESLNHMRVMIAIGATLTAISLIALLFAYVLLPLAPSRSMARAGVAAQMLAVPLTRRVLAGRCVQAWRRR